MDLLAIIIPLVIYFLVFAFYIGVFLLIQSIIASHMQRIAFAKGYGKEIHSFAMAFWLGVFGCIYVAALPDKVKRAQNDEIIKHLAPKPEKLIITEDDSNG